MPTAAFNLGRDCTIVIQTPTGRLDAQIVTQFDAKQKVKNLRIAPLNGPPIGADLPDGWDGTFQLDRANASVDDYFSNLEQTFWAAGTFPINITIYQYVQEVSGSTSTYQYDGVTMHLNETGTWKAEEQVKQTVTFFAATRRKVL